MHAQPFRHNMADYILSGHAYLHVPTTEKTRFLGELKEISQSLPDGGRQVFTWSQAVGWRDLDGNPPIPVSGVQFSQPDPQKVAQEILDLPEQAVFVLKDFGPYVEHRTFSYADVVIAWLSEIRDVLASTGRTVVFLGPEFDVPAALANDVTTVEFPLPDSPAIEQSVRFILDGHPCDETVLPSVVSACKGMTQQQVEDRTALALRKYKTLNGQAARLILHEKAEILRRSGLLKYLDPPEGGLSIIGGNDNVKRHIERDKTCLSEQARAFGIDPPRGLMLTGVSGCGKTQISLCTASELGIPLLQFDVGSMMSKWVGETEANVRTALQQVDSMAPCVLQMDEIEKGFGSAGHDGDSGAGLRAFGTVLKWLSERTCPVYVIMTANDVSRLPPEFTRKGRIDEVCRWVTGHRILGSKSKSRHDWSTSRREPADPLDQQQGFPPARRGHISVGRSLAAARPMAAISGAFPPLPASQPFISWYGIAPNLSHIKYLEKPTAGCGQWHAAC